MSDEHEVTAGMDRMIGELLEHADRDRLPDTSDEPLEQGLEASGLDGARARVEQAMRLIEQAGECLRSADAIALDIDPHYLAAAFTGKTVSLCDQLEQATKQTAAEVEEMRRQEPSVESSDGNDDSTAFFQDFLEGKKNRRTVHVTRLRL